MVGLHSPGPLGYKFHRFLCLNCNYYLGYLTISHDSAGKYVAIHLILCINLVHFLNQAHAPYLKIDPVRIIGMRICVCVSEPKAINN